MIKDEKKLNCDHWSVVTTIFEPSDAIKLQTQLEGWCTVIVGDVKSPPTYEIPEGNKKNWVFLDVDTQKKLLLILGIGVFSTENPLAYMEIMKRLAYDQRLFLIIASSDYIYGTNYQFCHGFIGKDLTRMTQQKTIQAIGRIGRNNIQQTYTVRFRDDAQISKLFTSDTEKPEIINMNKLFNSNHVKYEDNKYVAIVGEEEAL